MRHAREIARESHEYRQGYKILAKGQGGIEIVPEQAQSTIERLFGMSETEFGERIKALEVNQTHILTTLDEIKNSQTQANKTQNELLELVRMSKALALVGKVIGYPVLFWIATHLDGIYLFLKKMV